MAAAPAAPAEPKIDLGEAIDRSTLLLVVDAWMDWPETATFLSVVQNESIGLILPTVEVLGESGWKPIVEFEVDLIEVEFGRIEHDEARRLKGGDLTYQLRSDGAAGAGDQDALAMNKRFHACAIKNRLGSSQ